MTRHYFVRDRRVDVEELDGVVALRTRSDAGVERSAAVAQSGEPAEAVIGAVVGAGVLNAFHRAGWMFVVPNEITRATIDRSEVPEYVDDAGTVVVLPGGQSIGIVTKRLNVQLDPDLTEAQADAVLAERNLALVRHLGFARNLYETVATGWKDAIAASVELHHDSRFVFAEPALIEHIAGRAIPTDPNFGSQWQWSNHGDHAGTVGADVSATCAWGLYSWTRH